jgi:phosphopantothenoylcysteine decarboxylase
VPLSCNTLAKVVAGMCPDLLTSVILAWDTTGEIDGKKKRIVVAPAANSAMWTNPITAKHLKALEEYSGEDGWFDILAPDVKTLACGDSGVGAMRDWQEIVKVIEEKLKLNV